MTGDDIVAAFIEQVSWDAVPANTRATVLDCLLDDLGAMLIGTLAPSSHITAVGMGSSHPKSTTNQALNRRVEIVVHG